MRYSFKDNHEQEVLRIVRAKPIPEITDPKHEVCYYIFKTALYRGDSLADCIAYINSHATLKRKFNKQYRITFAQFKKWYLNLKPHQIAKVERQHTWIVKAYYEEESKDPFIAFVKASEE